MATKKEVKKETVKKPASKKPTANSGKTVKATNANLTPFKKGQSGNPNGRPKVPEDVREACKAASLEAVTILTSIMRNVGAKDADRIKAAEAILDRAYGKPFQAVAIEDSTDHSITIKWESEEYGA